MKEAGRKGKAGGASGNRSNGGRRVRIRTQYGLKGRSMRADWFGLGSAAPTTLVNARNVAHHAAQWGTKAARANLAAVPDDSHSSLTWDAERAALVSQPLAAQQGEIRVGLSVADLRLIVLRGSAADDSFALDGKSDAEAGAWLDALLRAAGLAPASDVKLPYQLPDHAVATGARYDAQAEAGALQELARWFGMAAEVLGEVSGRLREVRPGPGPVLCWPHHFDIAMVVQLEAGHAEAARSIGVGLSPGDESCAQPYWYVSPWPKPDPATLPPAPGPGHWHIQGYTALVATGEDILKLQDRRRDTLAFVMQAIAASRALLGL